MEEQEVTMYKRQVKLQKLICLFALIAGVAVFAYALGFATDLYDAFYEAVSAKTLKSRIPGGELLYLIQPFNSQLLMVGVGMILLAVLLFITSTQSRRRYYIGNYVSTGLYAVAAVAATVWAHMWIEAYKAYFLTHVDFAVFKEYAEKRNSLYTESTFWFDAHYVVFAVLILAAVLLVANAIWKVSLMKQEAKLLQNGEDTKKDVAVKA